MHHIDAAISKLTFMKDDVEEAPKLNLIDDIFVQAVNNVIGLLASTISLQKSPQIAKIHLKFLYLKDRGRTIPSTYKGFKKSKKNIRVAQGVIRATDGKMNKRDQKLNKTAIGWNKERNEHDY